MRVDGENPLFKPLLTFMPFKMIIKPLFGEQNETPKAQQVEGIFSFVGDEPAFMMLAQEIPGEFVQDTPTPDYDIESEAAYEVVAIDTDHNQLVETVSSMESFTYEEKAETFTTQDQKSRWEKMKLKDVLAELGAEYDIKHIREEFKIANPTAGDKLDNWIKRSIIDYGWRLGDKPPDITQTSVTRTVGDTPIIEAADLNVAFDIAVKEEHGIELKEFESFYWKDKVSDKTSLQTIYYGSKEAQYNKKHVDQTQRLALIEDLYLASGDITLYNNALKEKNTGEAFVVLVKSAQEVLFYDQPTEVDGMLGDQTSEALAKWKVKCTGFGFDAYIERIARRFAVTRQTNDATRQKYEDDKKSSIEKKPKQDNLKPNSADEQRFEFYALQIQDKRFAIYLKDETIVDDLLMEHPPTAKDKHVADQKFTNTVQGPYGISNTVSFQLDDTQLVLQAYDRLQSEKQSKANQNLLGDQIESKSPFTRQTDLDVEQFGYIQQLLILPGSLDSKESLQQEFVPIKNGALFKTWLEAHYAFQAKLQIGAHDMGIDGENPAPELLPTIRPLEDALITALSLYNTKMGWPQDEGFGYWRFEGDEYFTYDDAILVINKAGAHILLLLQDALSGSSNPDLREQQLLTDFASRETQHLRRDNLLSTATGEVDRVRAIFQTLEFKQESDKYNPSLGAAAPTGFPMQIYIEKKEDGDCTLHILLDDAEKNRDIHVDGKNIFDCMRNLAATHTKQLPDGTIFYYDPADPNIENPVQYSIYVEGRMSASEVFGYVALGLAVAGAALAAPFTGGGSLMAVSPVAAAFIGASVVAGITSSVCYLYERDQLGQLTGEDIALEAVNIVSSLAPGIFALSKAGLFTKFSSRLTTFNNVTSTARFFEFTVAVDVGGILVNGVSMTQQVIDALAEVDAMGPEVSEADKAEFRHRILMSSILGFTLLAVSFKSSMSDMSKIKSKPKFDDDGMEFRLHIENGKYFKKDINTGKLTEMNPAEIKKFVPNNAILPETNVDNRQFTVHTDGKGNYVKRFEDTGEEISINKAEFEAEGGIEPGRYEYSSYVEEGETKYRKKDLDTNQTSEIDKVEFENAKTKVLDQKGAIKTAISSQEIDDLFSDQRLKAVREEYLATGLAEKHPNLTIAEGTILYDYTGAGFADLNEALNDKLKTAKITEHFATYEKLLNQALDKFDNFDGVVFRGGYVPLDDILSKYQKGQTVTHAQFTSTSKSKTVADNFRVYNDGNVFFEITSKNGKFIQSISAKPDEIEVLFKSQGKFEVLSNELKVDDFGHQYYEIKMIQL